MTQLTIFYDGYCPLCINEVSRLKAADSAQIIAFEDIQAPDFQSRYPKVDVDEANRVILGLTANGIWLKGLDVSLRAWTLVGKPARVTILRWRWLRPLLDISYRFLARHRYQFSRLFAARADINPADTSQIARDNIPCERCLHRK